MPDLKRFRSLTVREQAIVCVAILLDGHDAIDFLAADKERGQLLVKAASDLAQLPPDLRMPLTGTLLRRAIDANSE